jgi:uncharacterized protein with FMN-binding domain
MEAIMKKILALMVCVLMLLSLAACANDNGNVDKGNDGVIDETPDETDDGVVDDDLMDEGIGDPANSSDMDKQTLEGTAQGYGGEVKVTVEVKGNDIVSVKAVGEKETEGVGSRAIDELPAKIEAADSTDVDGVSGATVTSNAIKEAVNKALEGMKK